MIETKLELENQVKMEIKPKHHASNANEQVRKWQFTKTWT